MVPLRYIYVTGGTMNERQRRRDIKWSRVALAGVVAGDLAGGWFLHDHNRLDIRAALVVLCMFVGTLVIGAALAVCHVIRSNHELTRDHQDNVVPIRRGDVDGPTIAMPLVAVGRAHPIAAAGVRHPGRPRLSFTAGDHTIDCALRDELEGETG